MKWVEDFCDMLGSHCPGKHLLLIGEAFEVKEIVKSRMKIQDGVMVKEWLVRWVNGPRGKKHRTTAAWEPHSSFARAQEKLDAFEELEVRVLKKKKPDSSKKHR